MATKKNTRNFSIEGTIEGRKTPIKLKTKTGEGEFKLIVKQRSNSFESPSPTTIEGKISPCGKNLGLIITVGGDTHTYWTPK